MKFVPLAAFEQLNAMLCDVETQGCLLTVRVEAFSTRKSKEEKQLQETLNHRHSHNGSEMQSPETGASSGGQPTFAGDVMVSPGPSSSENATFNDSSFTGLPPSNASVDDRLVFLIAALNAIHGQSEYDFSVLSESDFNFCEPQETFDEINSAICSVPNHPFGNDGSEFWTAIGEALMGNDNTPQRNQQQHGGGDEHQQQHNPLDFLTSGEVEYFQFSSPECDPLCNNNNNWSAHFFLICKKQRLILSVMGFSEQPEVSGDGMVSGGTSNQYVGGGIMNYVSPNSVETGQFPSEPY